MENHLEDHNTTWQVDRSPLPTRAQTQTQSDAPLKWAYDAGTRAARYIHDDEVVNGACICKCPACDRPLTPVLAGQPLRVRPTAHFRHPDGAPRSDCTLIAARLAVIRTLADLGTIALPRRRISRTATGFSGAGYEIWVEAPPETVVVTGAVLHDHATAMLTLDDGREILVDLTGTRTLGEDGTGRAVVTISLSDPAFASMSQAEIRSRLRILPAMHWCSHWNDRALEARGDAQAQERARAALDGWTDEDEAEFRAHLPPSCTPAEFGMARRETLLHRLVKEILEQSESIMVPELEIQVEREVELPDGTIILEKLWSINEMQLEIRSVLLERRLGAIVPDVMVHLDDQSNPLTAWIETYVNGDYEEGDADPTPHACPSPVLVEVTVTHGIDAKKLDQIRALDLPTLEIDFSLMGGQVTSDGLRDLVINKPIGKRWVHHPLWQQVQSRLHDDISLRAQRLTEEAQRRATQTVEECAAQFLEAAIQAYECESAVRRLENKHRGSLDLEALQQRQDEWFAKLTDAAKGLAAHGFPEATNREVIGWSGLLPRILSIQHNRGLGYALDSGFQVLNAIMQARVGSSTRWHSLLAIAVKAFALENRFTPSQAKLYASWRQNIVEKIKARDPAFLRPRQYDRLLALLFPEMAKGIASEFGAV